MSFNYFQDTLIRETILINDALNTITEKLPSSCRPIVKYILESGGKRMRPILLILCARLFGYNNDNIYTIASSMEMLHAATLLHDDILDNAQSRRGKKAAHNIFGLSPVILAGDALLAQGNAILTAFGNIKIVECFSAAIISTTAGEILEMNSLHKPELSHNEYLQIAKNKTGCLIAQSCQMGAFVANADTTEVEMCREYGENLGIAFQIIDDALDFAPESQTGKPCGGDLREGKMTPPLRLYRNSLSASERIHFDQGFKNASFSKNEEEKIIKDVQEYAAQAADIAKDYLEQAKSKLDKLPQTAENLLLRQMADYSRDRRH